VDSDFWKPGEMAKFAEVADISPQNLSDILHRRRRVGRALAWQLASAGRALWGAERISVTDWFLSEHSRHPAFFGDPLPAGRRSDG
jgi:hypothetical protein